MILSLRLHDFNEAPAANGGTSRFPALAWSTKTPTGGTIHVVRGFHRHFFPFARRVHEAEHLLTGEGNEMHDGHTFHFCAKSWHAIRIFSHTHAGETSILAAKRLWNDGDTFQA